MSRKTRPLLNFKQLFYLSLCGFGIQFASSLQNTNVSSLFKFLGAQSGDIGYLWLAAPIAGLIIQPVVGQFSDSTMTRFGKRIPYIFSWAILTCLALFFVPFANTLLIGAIFVWILNCSINGCTEALRALIGDIAPNEQKATAFAWQTIFCGAGAAVAALLPWILEHLHFLPKANETTAKIPVVLQVTFIAGSVIMLITMLIMVHKIKEKAFVKSHLLHDLQIIRHRSHAEKIYGAFRELFKNIKRMPKVIKDFSIVQVFTWIGMFCVWLYFGIGLAQHVFGLPLGVNVDTNPEYQRILEKGTIEAGICFGIYQFISVLYAFALPKLAVSMKPRIIHAVSLIIGAISLILILFTHNLWLIYVTMIGVGIMWGSIMTMPFAIISAELPRSKMGVYLGIFNITITLPQILGGLCMGTITEKLFHNHAMYSVVLGGVLILISGLILLYQAQGLTISTIVKKKITRLQPKEV
jgi:maltose/moltooligosaccharide transporter